MSNIRKMAIFNLICYGIGWIWSIYFGIHGYVFIVALVAILLITAQLLYTKSKSPVLYIQDLILLPFTTFLGVGMEMIFIQIGVVDYVRGLSFFPPMWIVVFYPLFSLLINHSLTKVTQHYFISFCMGFCFAPISYMAGKLLGGLAFYYPPLITWVVLGTFWGFFMCLMRSIANAIEKAAHKTFLESKNSKDLKLFYDGNCPICTKEVCYLQKRNVKNTLKFIDIEKKEQFEKEAQGLSYKSAMAKMHALDDQGNQLIGLDVFAAAYARAQKLLISTLVNISFLRPILDPMYTLFAKHRHLFSHKK